MTRTASFIAAAVLLLALGSCNRRTVTRIDPNETIDLSGRWNDSDSRMVAEAMIGDISQHPFYREYQEKLGRTPVIIVGWIKNKTSEHIDTDAYIKQFEIQLFNTGTAKIVEDPAFREKLRAERADQQEFASPETTAQWGRETGADLMLFGTMTSEEDSYNRRKVVNYITTLQLTDLETNERIWMGQQPIKKFIEN